MHSVTGPQQGTACIYVQHNNVDGCDIFQFELSIYAGTFRVCFACFRMGVFLVAFLVATIVCQHFYAAAEPQNEVTNGTKPLTGIQWKEFWVFRLLLNLIGYGTIIVPGYLIIRYVRGTELIKQTGTCIHVSNMLTELS